MNDWLIVGIGNIGEEYKNTRHNIGFIMLDFFANEYNINFVEKRYAYIAKLKNKENNVYLIKPTTYVNNSGLAVQYWMNWFKINIKNILVLVDDINIPFCEVRFREKGSSGGHNGLKSIEHHLGQEYARLRFGIGHEFAQGEQSNFVLQEFNNDEKKKVVNKKDEIIELIKLFIYKQF